ncbi:MAG TPA: hypothetical protein VK824_08575, partial [Planctomycetota bacterium]|nr:hypothetical protein [Planctomycetota bacterium]
GQPGCTCPMTQVVAPLGGYTHDEGCAIIGGYVYRGSKLPQLVGSYLYADYCGGKVWSLRHDGMQVTSVTDLTDQLDPALGQFGPLSSFGEDADGELYIVGYALGKVWKIVPAAAVPDCDGDGVPDADEIAAGTAFDHDADGMPDSCELQLTAGEVVAGKLTKLQFLGGAPGEPVLFFYTTRGIGPGPCWFGGAVCLQLLPPVGLLGGVAVNSAGVALLVVPVPAGTPAGVEVDFQALLYKGTQSVTSNPVIHVTQS